jgi:hypothetical protein
MVTESDPPRENELVLREIQEIREALEAFKAAVESGEMAGFMPASSCSGTTIARSITMSSMLPIGPIQSRMGLVMTLSRVKTLLG